MGLNEASLVHRLWTNPMHRGEFHLQSTSSMPLATDCKSEKCLPPLPHLNFWTESVHVYVAIELELICKFQRQLFVDFRWEITQGILQSQLSKKRAWVR